MFGNVWKCLEMFGNVWKCLEMFGNVWKCLEMFGDVWRCLEMFGKMVFDRSCALALSLSDPPRPEISEHFDGKNIDNH